MDKVLNIALIGASGVVGQKILQLLDKKDIYVDTLFPLGSSSVGQKVNFQNNDHIIEDLESFDPSLANITIFSAGSSVARKHARKFVEAGSYVIDLSSEFRYEDDVPLIIPEINGDILENLSEPTLIANPNCSTSQLLMALKPIHDKYGIEFINIATYQAVSGTGKDAVEELRSQTFDKDPKEPKVYPKPIAFNVIPQCDIFLDNAFTKEEMKLVWETQKILDKNIEVQATCARVPVFNGHSEAVFMKLSGHASREAIIDAIDGTPGVCIMDNPEKLEYPTPVEHANDSEDVYVGRIRSQKVQGDTWVSLWVVADNVYGKGAALNAVQILQNLILNNKLC
ncbi:aspartate-semialdehyde dehydrogenase [Gammaproteobacteria bacterium]|nr:aspartate-semialdehyde dehydrogenase [Gammaproteobacteria bacterium]